MSEEKEQQRKLEVKNPNHIYTLQEATQQIDRLKKLYHELYDRVNSYLGGLPGGTSDGDLTFGRLPYLSPVVDSATSSNKIFRKFPFWYKLYKSGFSFYVDISEGYVFHATEVYYVSAQTFSLGATDCYIYVSYMFGGTPSLSMSTNFPVNTEDSLRIPLYLFKQKGSSFSLAKIYHLGNIYIWSVFAK